MQSTRITPLQPADIGLILSYQCQSACKHCLYNCGPAWRDWIEPGEIQRALEMMSIWEGPFQVHITGGEPFINFPLLLRAVELAADLEIPRYVETNAGWCVNPELGKTRFSALRQAGLQAVLISCSPFHSEKIAPITTIRAIDIAVSIFGSHRVMINLPDWIEHMVRIGLQHPIPLDRYVEAYGKDPAGLMFWEGYGLISGGRAGYQLGHLTECRAASAFRGEDCYQDILFARHSHFDLYGNFIPGFCGGLSLGDWHLLPQILADIASENYSPLINILIESGPYGLYTLARDEYGYKDLPGGYAGKCHLCVDVRRQLVKYNEFSELTPPGFYDTIGSI